MMINENKRQIYDRLFEFFGEARASLSHVSTQMNEFYPLLIYLRFFRAWWERLR